MPSTSSVPYVQGHCYHIYNRAAHRLPIFFSGENYRHALRLFKKYLVRYRVTMIAYCLMPNHYHILARQEGAIPLSRFIQTTFNAYTQAVNRQRNHSGTLFAGRARRVWVDRDEYLMHLCRYIHLNPVKAGLVAHPEKWPYSNYLEWAGLRDGTLVDRDTINTYFTSPQDYIAFVADLADAERAQKLIEPYMLD